MGKTVYKNTHAVIRERSDVRQRLNGLKEKLANQRPLSVLMLSIDSVSRLNLIRAMPKTAQHLYDSGWFELQGYNKVQNAKNTFNWNVDCHRMNVIKSKQFHCAFQIDDNTFPNLMAILTGYNRSMAYGECVSINVDCAQCHESCRIIVEF